ncbi:MAG: hypothetical protein O6949_10465 [Chloroflexi bacterium]|nr:hypothetical protein [Chloroflexota bacterium]
MRPSTLSIAACDLGQWEWGVAVAGKFQNLRSQDQDPDRIDNVALDYLRLRYSQKD